jgi:GTPase SAR1 family protein
MNNFKPAKTIEYRNSSIDKSRLSDINASYLDKVVYRFKLILVGEYFVGKTSLITRYISDSYTGDYNCTLGVEFKIKSLSIDDTTAIDLQIWDTCGHDKYRSVTKQYFRDKSGKNDIVI